MAKLKRASNKGKPKASEDKGLFAVKTECQAEDVRIRKLRSKVIRMERAGVDATAEKAALRAFDGAGTVSTRDTAGAACVKLLEGK